MIKLNLLPDVKLEYLRTKRIQAKVISIATIVTIGVAALVVLLAIWVYGGQSVQKNYLTNKIDENSKRLKEEVPDISKYLTLQNQLAKLTALHEGKNDFSRLLEYLPTLNPAAPNSVTLTNIEILSNDTGNTLAFQGEVKDYTALATFRDTLLNAQLKTDLSKEKEKLFESVTVTSGALEKSKDGGQIVVFRIDTVYNLNAFLASAQNPVVTVPVKTTTQSAQSAPNVFGTGSAQKEQQ